jgi:RNA polymerase sigma-70 factor, ECF subfamily
MEQLYALVQQLDPLDRQVMVCYLDGMEASAISEIIGVSGGAVAMKIHRIKRVLAARFQRTRA